MRRSDGFTLIELIVTLSVMAILIAAAAPSMSDFIRRNKVAASANGLVHAISYARSEALRSGYPVTLCPTADATVAAPACVNSSNWSGMRLVAIQDANRTGNPSNAELLQVFDQSDSKMITSTPTLKFIRFLPNGSVQNMGVAAEDTFDVKPADCHGSERTQVSISRMGRVRSAKAACS